MARCEMCGNEYDRSFEVRMNGKAHTFDSFECAINMLAPSCAHCGCRIIGHGVQVESTIYCCASCARASHATGVADRAPERLAA